MNPAVLVVGSFNQDLTWRCAEFPTPGATIVGRFKTGPGGKGSNQAVAAARAGAPTAFVGALGEDAFGAGAEKFLRAEGITTSLAWKKLPTGNAAILVNDRGENQIIVALGANEQLAARDVPDALLSRARVVVAQHETRLETNLGVFRRARKARVTTVLNPAPMRDDFDARILALTDVLIPNETEFVALVNRVGPKRGTKLTVPKLETLAPDKLHACCRTLGVPAVVVTLGARGCLVSTPEGFVTFPAHEVAVVDTTGAGDAFVGAFASALAETEGDLLQSARFANAAAALSVTRFGTAPSMPQRRAILALLRRSHG